MKGGLGTSHCSQAWNYFLNQTEPETERHTPSPQPTPAAVPVQDDGLAATPGTGGVHLPFPPTCHHTR